jgi:hypothetical protein
MKLRLKLAVLVTAFLISAQNLRAQNLLKNGHFDVDVSGWADTLQSALFLDHVEFPGREQFACLGLSLR